MDNEKVILDMGGFCDTSREATFKHFGVPEALGRVFPYGVWENGETGFARIGKLPEAMQKSVFQRQIVTIYRDSDYPAMLVIMGENGPWKGQADQDLIDTIKRRAEVLRNLHQPGVRGRSDHSA